MTQSGSVTTVARRRLLFDDAEEPASAKAVAWAREMRWEVRDKLEDMRRSTVATLRAFCSALILQAEPAPSDARALGEKFKVFREVCATTCACLALFCKTFVILFMLTMAAGLLHDYNKTLELELHIKRAGHKFKTTKEPVDGIAETFSGIASLDFAVRGLWEEHHTLKKALAMARDRHEELKVYQNGKRAFMEANYAEQQMHLEGLHFELVKAKLALHKTKDAMEMSFAEMQKNLTSSHNRIIRAKLRLDHNTKTIKDANDIMTKQHGIPDEEEE